MKNDITNKIDNNIVIKINSQEEYFEVLKYLKSLNEFVYKRAINYVFDKRDWRYVGKDSSLEWCLLHNYDIAPGFKIITFDQLKYLYSIEENKEETNELLEIINKSKKLYDL